MFVRSQCYGFYGCSFIHVLCAIFHSLSFRTIALLYPVCTTNDDDNTTTTTTAATTNKQHLKPLLPTKMWNYFMGFNRFYYTSITHHTISRLGNSIFGLHNNLMSLTLTLALFHSLDAKKFNLTQPTKREQIDSKNRRSHLVTRWDLTLQRTRHMDDNFISNFANIFARKKKKKKKKFIIIRKKRLYKSY